MPEIGFAEPHHLFWFLPLLPLIVGGFLLKWHLSRRFDEFFQGETVAVAGLSPKRSWTKGAILSLAFLSMVLASGAPFVERRDRVPSFMAMVDISQSMWCEDYSDEGKPISRLETAKQNLLSLLDELPPEGRFGLGVFAGSSYPVLILTSPQQVGTARKDLKAMVSAIQYRWTWEDGTNIKEALAGLGEILDRDRGRYGHGSTVFILTDGEEMISYINRDPEVGLSHFEGIRLFFAGFGTEAGAPVPEFDENWEFKQNRKTYDGGTIVSRLDEGNLVELSRWFDGSYKRIETGSDLKSLLRDGTFSPAEYGSRVDVSWALWLGAFVLLLFFLLI